MWWDVVSISGFWSKLWVWDNPMIEWGYYNRLHWIFGCSSKGIISSMSLCRKQENSTVECQHPLADHTYLTLNKFEDGGGGLWTVRYNEGPQGPCGDNKITKNAITFERIEITEFCLKIWDPWTLPHTSRVHLMCRWGVSYPKWHPSNVKNYSIGHKSETDEPKPKKKSYSGQYIFTPFCQFWGQNSKYPMLQKPANFLTSGKSALNSPANGHQVRYSKIQNRLSRAP